MRLGWVAGLVYGISTIGKVFGTLFTTFALIPTIGSRSITYLFAGILALCTASLFLTPNSAAIATGLRQEQRKRREVTRGERFGPGAAVR